MRSLSVGILVLTCCLSIVRLVAAKASMDGAPRHGHFIRWPRGGGATADPILAVSSFSRHARVALAGGIAGAVGTAILYPVDTAKT